MEKDSEWVPAEDVAVGGTPGAAGAAPTSAPPPPKRESNPPPRRSSVPPEYATKGESGTTITHKYSILYRFKEIWDIWFAGSLNLYTAYMWIKRHINLHGNTAHVFGFTGQDFKIFHIRLCAYKTFPRNKDTDIKLINYLRNYTYHQQMDSNDWYTGINYCINYKLFN